MRPFLVILLFALSRAGAETIPLDPAIAMDQLSSRFRTGAVAERVVVRVNSESQVRGEDAIARFEPGASAPTMRLSLGMLGVWSDGRVVRLFDREDEQAYLERPVERGDVVAALEDLIPPLPLPHLRLAYPGEGVSALTPYCAGVLWNDAQIDAATGGMTMGGKSDRAEVLLIADGSGRIGRMLTTLDQGRASIELNCEPLESKEDGPIDFAIARRERVEDISDFRPRGARVEVGDAMPALGLRIWRDNQHVVEEPGGPCAVFLIRNWCPGCSPRAGYEAARLVGSESPEFSAFVGLILSPNEPNESAVVDGCEQEAGAIDVRRGTDAPQTLLRFTSESDHVLIVLDRSNRVVAIEPLRPSIPGAPVDTAQVDRLAGLMRRGLARE